MLVGKPTDVGRREDRAYLDAAVVCVGRLVTKDAGSLPFVREILLHFLMEGGVIVAQAQHVIGLLLDDLRGNALLTSGSVDGNHCALEVQQLQQFWYRGDLVALGCGGHLTKQELIVSDPRVHHVQHGCSGGRIRTAAHALAIDGHQLAPEGTRQGLRPSAERPLKGAWQKLREEPTKRIVGRNARRQLKKGAQPGLSCPTELLHIGPALGPTDHREHRDHDQVQQLVLAARHKARVFKVSEVGGKHVERSGLARKLGVHPKP